MSRKRVSRRLRPEQLEVRQLLAVDLLVEHDPHPDPEPGAEVTRVIRVHNIGDEPARRAIIRSALSAELVDPVWERHTADAKFITDPWNGREPDFRITGTDQRGIGDIQNIGDVNGDGTSDWLFHRQERRRGGPNWRSIGGLIVFGGVVSDVDVRGGRFLSKEVGVEIQTETAWAPYDSLGDVNGDGFDDLSHGDRLILGRADFGESVRVSEEILVVDGDRDIQRIFAIGDANADGINDFALQSAPGRIVWGHRDIGSESWLEVRLLAADLQSPIECDDADRCASHSRPPRVEPLLYEAGPVGDLNGDGFQDVAFGWGRSPYREVGTTVLYGGPNLPGKPLQIASVEGKDGFRIDADFGFKRNLDYQLYGPNSSPAGDIDGDGVDDMLISFRGGFCDCTATSKAVIDVVGGAVVIFGGSNVAANGVFDPAQERFRTWSAIVGHEQQRPAATAFDIDGDGLNEIEITTGAGSYVIRDPSHDRDLGFGGEWWSSFRPPVERYLGFNGENGYVQRGRRVRLDMDADGRVDEVLIDDDAVGHVFLNRPNPAPMSHLGSGDIEELIDITPGTSLVYTARGTIRENAKPISSTVVADPTQAEVDLRDNVVSDRDGVDLQVELIGPEQTALGGNAEVQVRITNAGPRNATNARFDETISAQLEDATWRRSTQLFPAVMELESLQGADGARLAGPRRAHERGYAIEYSGPRYTSLGLSVGSDGDSNGDGIDDIYGVGNSRNFRTIIFAGGEDFGMDGAFPEHEAIEAPGRTELKADVNGDGIMDAVWANPTAQDERGATYVVFGMDSGIPELEAGELNGANGFVIHGERSGDLSGSALAAGDVNGDGFDDVVLGAPHARKGRGRTYVVYGTEPEIAELQLDELDGVNGLVLSGPAGMSGYSIATGDVNGDDMDDVIIGAPRARQNSGDVYVVFGTAAGIAGLQLDELNGANGFAITGEASGEFSGFTVGTGDVNGDGFADVMVGGGWIERRDVDYDDPVQVQPHISVVFGGPLPRPYDTLGVGALDGMNGFRLASRYLRADSCFNLARRTSVASDFDVNGDGVDDILIGDTYGGADAGEGVHVGTLYVVFGRRNQDADGIGPIDDTLQIPFNSVVVYKIQGTVPNVPSDPIVGTVTLTVDAAQVELDPRSNHAALFDRAMLPGDLDFNGQVGFDDFVILVANFGKRDASDEDGDINRDGTIDFADFQIFANNFGLHR